VAIFSAWEHRTILSQRPTNQGFLERGVRQGPGARSSPEAGAFSLSYKLILDFLSMIYNINLRCFVDIMNKCN